MRFDPMFAARLWEHYRISVHDNTCELRRTAADYRDACITYAADLRGSTVDNLQHVANRLEAAAMLIEWHQGTMA